MDITHCILKKRPFIWSNKHLNAKAACAPIGIINDAPPSSLMDSISGVKVTTMEGEGVWACSLTHNISKVKGRAGALG